MLLQNGLAHMSQEHFTCQVAETLHKKRHLITQAHELKSQVKQLQSNVEISEQLVNQLPQGQFSKTDKRRKVDHGDPENMNPLEGGEGKQRAPKSEKKSLHGRPTNRNRSNRSTKKGPEIANPSEINLSFRKLLETTRSDRTAKSAPVTKVKMNGHMDTGRLNTDLNKTRPSLPISIPLDCLPENKFRQAMEQAGKTSQDSSLHGKHITVNQTSYHPPTVKASIDHTLSSLDKSSSWTPSNVAAVGNVTVVYDKAALPKKYGHLMNGATLNKELFKQSIMKQNESQKHEVADINNGSSLKRKGHQEVDSVSKRLLLSGDMKASLLTQTAVGLGQTLSPESRTSTAMLISTANQPLAISAIASPDLHGKHLLHRNDGMCVFFILEKGKISFI